MFNRSTGTPAHISSILTALAVLLLALSTTLPAHSAEVAPRVRMVTSVGEMVLELNAEKAPETVDNFLQYVEEGFYEGTIFHRVIDGFMVQGGGYTADLSRKPTRAPIRNEADNGLRNTAGTIAMARTSDPHSATAQFFINVADNTALDFRARNQRGWGYCVFGKVVEGRETLKRIKEAETRNANNILRDVPIEPIVIEEVIRLDTNQPKEQ